MSCPGFFYHESLPAFDNYSEFAKMSLKYFCKDMCEKREIIRISSYIL